MPAFHLRHLRRPVSARPTLAPVACPICEDERQYIPPGGQRWTTLAAAARHPFQRMAPAEPDLFGIGTTPAFAIGQRALLVRTPAGNVLWDCITLLDDATIALVRALGGIAAIAISHPHYYGSMVGVGGSLRREPSGCTRATGQWVMRPDPAIRFWSGATQACPAG